MVDNRLIHKSIGRLCTGIAIFAVLAVTNVGCAQTVLITGANSGLGLEFSKQYAAKGWNVIATHRRDEVPDTLADLMSDYENVRVEKMDG